MWKSLPEQTVVVDSMENPPRWTWMKTNRSLRGRISSWYCPLLFPMERHENTNALWHVLRLFSVDSNRLLAANILENLGQNSPCSNIWARHNVHGKDGLGTHCIPAASTCCHQCQRKNLETATCHHAKPHKRIQKAHVRKRICSCNTTKDLQGLKDVAVG